MWYSPFDLQSARQIISSGVCKPIVALSGFRQADDKVLSDAFCRFCFYPDSAFHKKCCIIDGVTDSLSTVFGRRTERIQAIELFSHGKPLRNIGLFGPGCYWLRKINNNFYASKIIYQKKGRQTVFHFRGLGTSSNYQADIALHHDDSDRTNEGYSKVHLLT